ncbi:WYL domain-containing protein [Candidatus Micrarchaeota archaeon]|nr:WYL domain-containing protein [Candidatus Micrarchaeota archaeon]
MDGKKIILRFTPSQLQAVYKLAMEYEEKSWNNEEDYGSGHYDEFGESDELIDKKQIKSILKKIGASLPKKAKEEMDKGALRRKYHAFNNDIDERVYATLKKAFGQSRTVEIKYFSMERAEFTKRKIDVYYASARYTIGYCHLRRAVRKFRTSRIASAKLTDSTYKTPNGFDKNDF